MKVNQAHEELLKALSGLDQGALAIPMAPGKWPIRDMLAHLIYWNQLCLDFVRERVAGGNPVFPSEEQIDGLNSEAAKKWAGYSPGKLLEELDRVRQDTIVLSEEIGPQGIKEKWQYGDGQVTEIGEFIDSFAGHQLYHCKHIREWRAKNNL